MCDVFHFGSDDAGWRLPFGLSKSYGLSWGAVLHVLTTQYSRAIALEARAGVLSEKQRRLVSSVLRANLDWLLVSACWVSFDCSSGLLVCSKSYGTARMRGKVFLNWEDVVRWSWFSLRYTEP
ncbi:MAG: CesT family type III secretion system chaperone [Slackia sp.]